ncbi:hypothetical protein TNCV_922041 [Trichonephila clavipes]|nr:hypothetical protein TNCV_922041 [Trichonephila clavipes]
MPIYSDEGLEKLKDDQKRLEAELQSTYEEFKLPKKATRTIKEIPVEQVICTSNNKFAALEVEDDQTSGEKSSDPPAQAKPIMLRIVKDYNLIAQDISRKFPTTVNKMTGNHIKIQPGSVDDPRDIATLLEEKKAEHYVIEPLANRPIKGLPVGSDVAASRPTSSKRALRSKRLCNCVDF